MEDNWKRALKNWLVNEDKTEILQHFAQRTLRDYASPTGMQSLDKISLGKKLRLYEITGIEAFNIGGILHPDRMDIEAIIAGEQDPSVLLLRLEYDGELNKTELARKCGVSGKTFNCYLNRESLSPSVRKKIETGLREIYGDKETAIPANRDEEEKVPSIATPNVQTPERTSRPETARGSEIGLDQVLTYIKKLASGVAGNTNSESLARVLHLFNEPSPASRIEAVNTAIDILADEADYFRNAPLEERKQLARSIDVDSWGYAVAVLGKIDQPETYETTMRLFSRPKKERREGR